MKKLGLTIFFDSFALMLLGLIIVMSASSTYSVFKFDSVFYLFNSHLFKVFIGIGAIIYKFLDVLFCNIFKSILKVIQPGL